MASPVLLKCGCWRAFEKPTPALGDELYCRAHGPTVVVESVNYKLECTGCVYRRSFGNAPITAKTYASKHHLKRKHTIRIIKYVNSRYSSETKVGGNHELTLDETLGS